LQGHYLNAVAEQVGFGYRRLMDAESLRDAMLDTRLAHRETVPTDLRWCPAMLALLLLVWRFLPGTAVSFASMRFRATPVARFFGSARRARAVSSSPAGSARYAAASAARNRDLVE
jgi:mxaL protein